MLRVNKSHPCPVCERSDWCLYSEDGSAVICARISEGSQKKCGDAGWLHVLCTEVRGQKSVVRRKVKTGPSASVGMTVNFETLAEQYQQRISRRQVAMLGASLGVSAANLVRLGVGWDGEAFCFPMRDENMRIIGIRRRLGNGRKLCVTGSRNGLFIPSGLSNDKPLLICEGPTDTAAGLDLGFQAIGRPNCGSKVEMTVEFARGRKVVIVCDNDAPGRDGAKKLAKKLIGHCPEVKIICPPVAGMDLREWKLKGFDGGRKRYGF